MPHPFQTVHEAGFVPPPGHEDWLFVASFSPLLPDRYNAWFLYQQTARAFPDQCLMIPDEPELDVVVSIEFIIAPDEKVAAFVQEKLELIERGDILNPRAYWKIVTPIIQQLWEGESATTRGELCRQAGLDADRALEPEVPPQVYEALYRQVTI